MDKKAKRPRAKNFSANENMVLVEEIEKRRSILFGPLKGPNLTQFHRDREWEKVLEAVNAVAPTVRSAQELKRKIKDLKVQTKKKANELFREGRKTGGSDNDATPLNDWEEKLLSFIGTESVEGISGGIDTYRREIVNKLPRDGQNLPESNTPIPVPQEQAPKPRDNSSLFEVIDEINLDPSFAVHSPSPSTSRQIQAEAHIQTTPPPSLKNPCVIPKETVPSTIPPVPQKNKHSRKKIALEQIKITTQLQRETNDCLKETNVILRGILQEMKEANQIRKRTSEVMEEMLIVEKKKQKII